MTEGSRSRPTDAELAILHVLWDRGEATVREVHDELKRTRAVGYTTVLKLLQIMNEKGLVDRDESQRSHVYRARLAADRTRGQIVRDILDRAFDGSAHKLVMQALSEERVSSDELAQIRELLDKLEGGVDDGS